MNPFIKYLRRIAKCKQDDDNISENITYTFESVYPDIETMEEIEKIWRDSQNKENSLEKDD